MVDSNPNLAERKGFEQIVIPKEARVVFDIHPGDHLLIFADAKQGMAIPPKESFDEHFKRIFG